MKKILILMVALLAVIPVTMAVIEDCNMWGTDGPYIKAVCSEEIFHCDIYPVEGYIYVKVSTFSYFDFYLSEYDLGGIFGGIELHDCNYPFPNVHTMTIQYYQHHIGELGDSQFGASCVEYKNGDLPFYGGNGVEYYDNSGGPYYVMDECFRDGLALVNTCDSSDPSNLKYIQTLTPSVGLECGFQ